MAAHKQTANEAVAFQRVDSRCKGQNGSLLGRGELHLGKVVDEEVEFCGHAAQTGLDQPDKMRKSFNYIQFRNYMLDSEDLQTPRLQVEHIIMSYSVSCQFWCILQPLCSFLKLLSG